VTYSFVAGDCEQLMLMGRRPCRTGYLMIIYWLVLDVVAELICRRLRAGYRMDGRGGAAYDPR
jgi:hypothetical protein